MRDPDRFGAWLAGIVRNVYRASARRAPLTLLDDWPEALHPASAEGLPSADELDLADALRAAVADRGLSDNGTVVVVNESRGADLATLAVPEARAECGRNGPRGSRPGL